MTDSLEHTQKNSDKAMLEKAAADLRQIKYFNKLMDEPDPVQGVCAITRYLPHPRSFQCPLYMFKFECRYPPSRRQGWGAHFLREDHFGDPGKSLDICVREEVKKQLNIDIIGRIDTICHLRMFGCGYNPMIPYFCYDEFDNLVALAVAVQNVPWEERHVYAMRVGEPGSMRHNPALKPSLGSTFFPNDPSCPNTNEDRERAAREAQFSTLVPALHIQSLHMSPFNPSPKQELWYYHFRLRGKGYLKVDAYKPRNPNTKVSASTEASEVDQNKMGAQETASSSYEWDVEKDELQFSASWDFGTTDLAHEQNFGAWRALWDVYYNALQMYCFRLPSPNKAFLANEKRNLKRGLSPLDLLLKIFQGNVYTVYPYTPPLVPWNRAQLWHWILLLLPAAWLLIGRSACTSTLPSDSYTAWSLAFTSFCMIIAVRSGGRYFGCRWIAWISGSFVAIQFFLSLSWMDLNIAFLGICITQGMSWLITGDAVEVSTLCALLSFSATGLAIQREECAYPGAKLI